MQKHLLYIFACLLITVSACKKGFLDRYPQTSISPQLFFKSEEDLSLYIDGLLSLPGKGEYFEDQSSDNMATTGAIEIKSIMTGNSSSQTITTGWSWGRLRNINYFMDNYDQAKVAQDVKDHYAGLARYYRAVFYAGMLSRFSDVPWYSHTINPDDGDLYKARDPRTLVADSIMADLSFAASHVRETVTAGTPGLWAVKQFFARFALNEGTYRKYHPELNLQSTAERFLDTAIAVSKGMISSGKFSIYNTGKPDQDYAVLFNSQDLSTNKEVILAYPYDQAKGVGSNQNTYLFGDYEQSPSRDLVQTYLMKDGTRFTDVAGYNKLGFVDEFKNRDPRMTQTLVYPGWIKLPDTAPYVQRLNKNFTGYHQLKGYVNNVDNNVVSSVDYPVYRYAETLLIFAEALAEKGTLTQTDLDQSVNLLRARAGLPSLNMAIANASIDPLLAVKYPDVSGAMTGTLLEIRRERRVELAMEGYRYDDLMRWHAGSVLTKIPQGMYFQGLGKYDLTGDGEPDIILISKDSNIPAEDQKEKNGLGVKLVYYKTGAFGESATVYLENGNSGGAIVTENTPRQFLAPKYYYRPVPYTEVLLNPALAQIFDWQ
ncbi:RagB/SusD family nutrient uptake outer membrane protein [Chitinophaga ginsengisoli]|uniref:SusD-like starch-binding protein associating with outer membrane n=1 Tax=Chitinophaga ginsengisoli TaxID=363837 RepID=A0A2P8GD75_9BACT|nr:RagB/SusD family nutrient uptake outer membrane protein [Chitinophaga ginsengisoli]PSL31910.1 SusD-like starch-binding protein associating with outer membrane [Chitinophaga ginsengisoli]